MQRFKAALTTGNYPGNPESLVRDNNGDFVLYADVKKPVVDELKKKMANNIIFRGIGYIGEPERFNCHYCHTGWFSDAESIKHEEGCIYVASKNYIESMEGE